MKCLGEKCKYYVDSKRDCPGYCGLIGIVNKIFKVVDLPEMKYNFYFSNEIPDCRFSKFDICKANNIDFHSLED